jgi:peptide/nickel transport system substrate-binding protein
MKPIKVFPMNLHPTAHPLNRCLFLFVFFILSTGLFLGIAHGENIIKIGLPEEPKTLNVWAATDTWSNRVLNQLLQPLYIREPKNLKLIPWLAAENPIYDPATLSYTIKIRPSKWSDGSEFTSHDVAFTAKVIQTFRVPRFISNWEFIKKIETPDKQTVRFFLKEPKALFLSRTLTTPIVQKKQWAPICARAENAKDPLNLLLKESVAKPIGTGPFEFSNWEKGKHLLVKKNPFFFGTGKDISGFRLGPYVRGIQFRFIKNTDAAVLGLFTGSIDMYWWGLQENYIHDLDSHKDITVFTNQKSALYYMGINMRKKPFKDRYFRKAIALSVDKPFIIRRIVQGYAVLANSIIPSGNTFWYDPNVPNYGQGLTREQRIRKAYKLLRESGYTWELPPVDREGKVMKGQGIRYPDGTPMETLTILTPPASYDPKRAMVGNMVQQWLEMLGIPIVSKSLSLGYLIKKVKGRHDFDCVVLGYGNLSLDPDYLRNFFISRNNKPGGWNTSGYSNPQFDQIADASSDALDVEKRRQLIWQMQNMIMDDVPWIPLYSPKVAEGARQARFTGWISMLGGIGNRWSFCCIKPK